MNGALEGTWCIYVNAWPKEYNFTIYFTTQNSRWIKVVVILFAAFFYSESALYFLQADNNEVTIHANKLIDFA